MSLGWPSIALAAEPAVQVQAKLGKGVSPEIEVTVVEAAAKGAATAEVEVSDDAAARLEVTITWSDERQLHYAGEIVIVEGGKELRKRSFFCETCGTDTLIPRVESEVALALGGVPWPEPGSEPEPEPAVTTEPDPQPIVAGPSQVDDPPRSGKGMLVAGSTIAGVGVLAVVGGIVMFTRPDELELMPDSADGPVYAKTFRPPGIALLAGGAGAVVIGTTLIVVDVLRKKKQRNVAAAPTMGAGFVGVSLGGRF